jgi:hypothetical protein
MKKSRLLITLGFVSLIFLTLQVSAESRNRVVVFANSIDGALASDFYGFLRNNGMEVVYVNASSFQNYMSDKFIVILGGQNAPEGVGGIVREILSDNEQGMLLASNTSRRMFVKTNVWTQGQVVRVIAGYEKEQTREAWIENKGALAHGIRSLSTTTVASEETCESFCVDLGYSTGVCRMSPSECRLRGKDEVYEHKGDQFCRYRTGHDDTCCCIVVKQRIPIAD